jgi:hypothetical protein
MSASEVGKRVTEIFERRKAAAYALCLAYAARALAVFREQQHEELFWQNQTGQAYARVFASTFLDEDAMGWQLAHGVQYGVYLELANDRRHEALRPVVEYLLEPFMKDLRELYG